MGELEIFSLRIKELRESLEMTQKDFSEHIGIKQQTLSGYERGIMKPPIDVTKNIAQKCNVSIDWLCGLSDKKTLSDEIKTFADAIKIIINLEQKLNISVCIEYTFGGKSSSSIYFRDSKMNEFLKEWEKMKDLHDNNIIDDDVYNLWIEKTLKKYDTFPITTITSPSPDCFYSEEELPFNVDEPPQE
ncbi:MAG: helix-turn-helix transcriptional regulator [Lachnospiraceae bacterium]|jgi:transcriptional regulator with XRE-family HTH domain|nr:helix-turn-helix transcriptional regulator [Lachnospiraceae bacterium]